MPVIKANANSALLVQVTPAGLSVTHPLDGIRLSGSSWNINAFLMGGGQRLCAGPVHSRDFLAGPLLLRSIPGALMPSYARGVVLCDLHRALSDATDHAGAGTWASAILTASIHGFADTGILTACGKPQQFAAAAWCRDPQTLMGSIRGHRTACGEGAGYAGGIVTSAVDGDPLCHVRSSESSAPADERDIILPCLRHIVSIEVDV